MPDKKSAKNERFSMFRLVEKYYISLIELSLVKSHYKNKREKLLPHKKKRHHFAEAKISVF